MRPGALAVPPRPRRLFLLQLDVLGPVVRHRPRITPAVAAPILWVCAPCSWAGGRMRAPRGSPWAGLRRVWRLLALCVHTALALRRLREERATALGLVGGLGCLGVGAVLGASGWP